MREQIGQVVRQSVLEVHRVLEPLSAETQELTTNTKVRVKSWQTRCSYMTCIIYSSNKLSISQMNSLILVQKDPIFMLSSLSLKLRFWG